MSSPLSTNGRPCDAPAADHAQSSYDDNSNNTRSLSSNTNTNGRNANSDFAGDESDCSDQSEMSPRQQREPRPVSVQEGGDERPELDDYVKEFYDGE